MSEDMPEYFGILKSFVTGGLCGLLFGYALNLIVNPSNVDSAKIFHRERDNLSVMRLYKSGKDTILVEDIGDKEYILLDTYLSKLEDTMDEADIKIEKEEIKKSVNWYKN